jgi:hypothetical protein
MPLPPEPLNSLHFGYLDLEAMRKLLSRRVRAKLGLAELSEKWNLAPENRQLPSFWERATIRLLTGPKDWTDKQRRMMWRAGRVHAAHSLVALLLLTGTAVAGMAVRQWIVAAGWLGP